MFVLFARFLRATFPSRNLHHREIRSRSRNRSTSRVWYVTNEQPGEKMINRAWVSSSKSERAKCDMIDCMTFACSTRTNRQTKQTFNITKSVNHSLVNLKPVKPASFTQFVFTVNFVFSWWFLALVTWAHKLQTSNEGVNQRNLKILADVADKIFFGRT